MSIFNTNKSKLSEKQHRPQSIIPKKTDIVPPRNDQMKNSDINETSKLNTINIDICLLQPNPFQPRTKFIEIEELSESILKNGLLQPPIVFEENGTYFILAGERRVRAIKKLFEDKKIDNSIYPVIVKNIKNNDDKRDLAIIENTHRDNMTTIDLANSVEMYLREGKSYSKIAEIMATGKTTISRYKNIAELPIEVKDLLNRDKINATTKIELLKDIDDLNVQLEFAQLIIQDISISQLRNKINKYLRSLEEKETTNTRIEDPYNTIKPLNKLMTRSKYKQLNDVQRVEADEILKQIADLQLQLEKVGQ